MILSANQPYFSPFPGFFLKAYLSDIFVLLDDVQFPRGTTWLTRNRFKDEQSTLWVTIPVWKKGLGLQKISKVRICHEGRWRKKHLASLRRAYARAPYLEDHIGFMESVFTSRFEKLSDLNLSVIKYFMKHLRIKTRIVSLSELGVDATGNDLLIEICKKERAETSLAQYQAQKYLDTALFRDAGIELRFFNQPAPIYPQLWGSFIGNLSALDLLLNCGPKAHDIMVGQRKDYQCVEHPSIKV